MTFVRKSEQIRTFVILKEFQNIDFRLIGYRYKRSIIVGDTVTLIIIPS